MNGWRAACAGNSRRRNSLTFVRLVLVVPPGHAAGHAQNVLANILKERRRRSRLERCV